MIVTKREVKESARDYALRQLRSNIVSLELKPGSEVSENELAKELGLSRTPVREALQELHKNKLIEVYPQRGIIISRIDFDIVNEMAFLRRVLEKAVVEELCDCITKEGLKELESNVELQEFYLNRKSPEKVLELDNEFHRSLFIMCNKERVYLMMEATQDHFNRVRTLSLFSIKDLKIIDDHRRILEAIKSGSRQLAADRIVDHLSRYRLDQSVIMEKYPEFFPKKN